MGTSIGPSIGNMNGILIINKASGWTSFDVVAKARGKLDIKKIGHTGTLDPLATGVLVLCLGKATKLAGDLTGLDKEYVAEITFGATSNTDDAEGIILPNPKLKTQNSKQISNSKLKIQKTKDDTLSFKTPVLEEIETVLKQFEGEIMQIPPQFSAKIF